MDLEKYTDYSYNIVKEICEKFGPRPAGSQAEHESGNFIEEKLKEFCDSTCQEELTCHPKGFLGFIRYAALMALGAIILFLVAMSIDFGWLQGDTNLQYALLVPAACLTGFALIYLIGQVMTYHHLPFIDALFPEEKLYNVIGVIEPAKEPKKTLILGGHHDVAYEFNLFYYLKTAGAAIIFLGLFGIMMLFGVVVFRLVALLAGFATVLNILWWIFFVVFVVYIPICAVCVFFVNMNKPVLGAFDNLSGSAMAMGVGKYLVENGRPNHVRIKVVSFAGEEAGLRGSFAYVKKHANEMNKDTDFHINFDGIGEKDKIIITTSEPLAGSTHDKKINQQLMKIAKEKGIPATFAPLPFGATDATPFSKAGFRGTNISAFEAGAHLPFYYHTRADTPEVLEKEVFTQVYEIVLEFIKRLDEE